VAIIRRAADEETLWLAQWNRNWGCYNFVSGHRHSDETFRECVTREVEEELGLASGIDFEVAAPPLTRLEYQAWSAGAGELTRYTMELYEVRLSNESALARVNQGDENSWLSEDEIRAGRRRDGRPVSETMLRMLHHLQTGAPGNPDP
jgi:8-oxo-dGTP pyrophosphatase MutT (NUDIX family)